ncbi:restriction endonuclease subunit S [Rhizobium bangladeshense]|uniref:restriction endonuclease subunit S n=1 Tax=Rhizobium bangladeshense TaxID=1138189 RepID=UPI001A992903|nr:restriction endonuclease subunit S [Rhizobium bangladeshense]QSY95314.1 restriction endonuclease subunit S [Rhizobium bangladeshense]
MSLEPRWPVPSGWGWTSIENIADVTGGGTPPANDPSNFAEQDGIPWITPADLTGYKNAYIERGRRNLSERGYKGSAAKLLPAGAVLFTSRAPIGYCAIAANPIATSQGFKSLTLFGGIAGEFVRHYLRWSKPFLESLASGTTFLELSGSKLQQVPFPLPPLAEQKRIVAKLDALNAKSARARAELARIETLVSRYKQAVLSKAFSGELTQEWRGDGHWPQPVRLGDVAGSFAYGSAAKSQKTGSVPVLRMGNIHEGKLDWTDLVFTDDKDEIEKYRLSPGDVLFNRTNSPALVGKTALFSGEREAIFAGYLIRIVAGPHLDCRYLTYALNSPSGREFSWTAKTDGVSQSNISATKLKEFLFTVPSLEEQTEIVRRIETAFTKIDRLAAEARRALDLVGKLDEAILTKAFRGELVPQDENDEPASLLLERIKHARVSQPAEIKRKTPSRQERVINMARTIFETLVQAKDWLSAQELFERCGVRDGSSTEDVEKLYRQLLELERQEKVEIEEIVDPSTGVKQGNRVRLRK